MQIQPIIAAQASDIPDTIKEWLSIFPEGVAKWIAAILIFIVGSFIAKALGKLTQRGAEKTSLDNKIVSRIGGDSIGIEKLLGKIVYGLVMLFVIAIALQAAELEGVTEPITNMLSSILAYIPRIFGAAAILFIGYMLAKIVRQLLEGAMVAARVDQRLNNNSAATAGESTSITRTTGAVVFSLIILVFLPAALQFLKIDAISDPILGITEKVLGAVPNILLAGVILAIGYKVAVIVKDLIANLLNGTGINALPAKIGLDVPTQGPKSLSSVVGYVVMISIMVIIGSAALNELDIDILNAASAGFVEGYFNVLLAVLILGAGILLSRFAYKSLADKDLRLAKIAKVAIIVVSALAAIDRSKIIDPIFVEKPYEYFLIAVAGAFIIGGGIALGLGGKDYVSRKLQSKG